MNPRTDYSTPKSQRLYLRSNVLTEWWDYSGPNMWWELIYLCKISSKVTLEHDGFYKSMLWKKLRVLSDYKTHRVIRNNIWIYWGKRDDFRAVFTFCLNSFRSCCWKGVFQFELFKEFIFGKNKGECDDQSIFTLLLY